MIEKIFNPYFTSKEEGKGTGIGLYMSMQIINNMKGTLSVQNCELETKDSGTKFTIELPTC